MLSAIGTANSFKGNSHVKTSPKRSMFRSLAAASALMVGGTGLAGCAESPTAPVTPQPPSTTLSQEALATAQQTGKNTYAIYQNLGVPIEVTSSTSGPVAARALSSEANGDLYFSKQEYTLQGQNVVDSAIGVQSDGGTRILTRTIDDIGDTTFVTTTRYPIDNGYKSVGQLGGASELMLNNSGATLNRYDQNGNVLDKNLTVVAKGDTIFVKDSAGKIVLEETGVKTYFSKKAKAISALFTKPSVSRTELATKLESGAARTLKIV